MSDDNVFDVQESDFEERVIKASTECPIVVDFWASWCAPCRILGPVLERVVASFGGSVKLAKLNTEQNPGLARTWGIQGIPAVKVFRDGRVVQEFVGALPEEQVQQILRQTIPSEGDERVREGDRLEEAGQHDEAEEEYRQALAAEPRHPGASVRLAKKALATGDISTARELAGSVPEDAPEREEAAVLLARIEFHEKCAEGGGREACSARIRQDGNDLDARFGLAMCLAAEGEYREALEQLMYVIQADKSYRDNAARDTMVRIFGIIGQRSELADEYRDRLAKALY